MVTTAVPNGPGVQTTAKPVLVTLVGARQLPPDNVTATVDGKLMPVNVNAVGLPGGAVIGVMLVTMIVPAPVSGSFPLPAPFVMMIVAWPIKMPPATLELLLIETVLVPIAPGVQTTLKLVAVATVAAPQIPPDMSAVAVSGKFVPLTVNVVGTAGRAVVGVIPVTVAVREPVPAPFTMVMEAWPIEIPPAAIVLLVIVMLCIPDSPAVQITLKLLGVALVIAAQVPPARVAVAVRGKLLPLTAKVVATPVWAVAGDTLAILATPALLVVAPLAAADVPALPPPQAERAKTANKSTCPSQV